MLLWVLLRCALFFASGWTVTKLVAQYILAHVIRKMGDAGVRNATFGAGATPEMQRVENIGGFRVRTLEKAYNGISHTFNLGNKGDFRSKFGSHQEPVSRISFLGVFVIILMHLL
jgi:hypothetical protein